MKYRRLGRLGLAVSEYALGTRGLDAASWKDLDLAEAGAAMAFALEQGVNVIDAAQIYGGTEELVGDVLKRAGARQDVHVISKAPPLVPLDLPSSHVPAETAYPGWHVRACTEASLKRLGVERLCIQQLYPWTPEWLHEGDWLETLHRLREEGKIAGVGVSLFEHDAEAGLEAVASGAVDCVQVMYNLFDQGAAAGLLSLCRKQDVAVVTRSPLYFGTLSTSRLERRRPFPPDDWRSEYFYDEHLAETRRRVTRLARQVEPPDRSVTDMALRFSLSHPAIATVAVGMRTRKHVEANLQALAHGPLPPEKLRALAEHRWLC
jgi:aryl-alcohol dehydrogenase-like predicted oxidoreductase